MLGTGPEGPGRQPMDSNWPLPAPSCSPTLGRQGILSLFPGGGAQETGQAGHCVLWGGGQGEGLGCAGRHLLEELGPLGNRVPGQSGSPHPHPVSITDGRDLSGLLVQESANFCERPEGKYLRFCRLYSFHHSCYS